MFPLLIPLIWKSVAAAIAIAVVASFWDAIRESVASWLRNTREEGYLWSPEGKISPEEKILYAKLSKLKVEHPKVISRSFKEFISKIDKVDYTSEPGECCLRGHHTDSYFEDLGDYVIPSFLRKPHY